MLYMGNVNRIILWVLIPLILILYLAFRLNEWRSFDDGRRLIIAEQHALNLSNPNDINCLILGGSNSVYSISAKQMSQNSELSCYNLSLLNEGYSDKAYFDFIRSMPIDNTNITNIFYSTVYPLSQEAFVQRLDNNNKKIGILGEQNFQLVGKSIASYLKDLLEGKSMWSSHQNPNPTATGDFNFTKYDGCDSAIIEDKWALVDVNATFSDWMNGNISSIRLIFPNAQIYFVLPSTLRTGASEEEFSGFTQLIQKENVDPSVIFVEQSPFSNTTVLCDGTHHANAIGREIRTTELLEILHMQNN